MEAIITAAIEVGKCIVGPVKRQFNYLCCFSNNIKILRDEAQKLNDVNDGLQMRVNRAEDNAHVIYPQVKTWLESASQSKKIISEIEDDVPKVQKGCWNLILRYSLSRKAKKTAEALRVLCNDCNFNPISQDAPPVATESLPLEPKEKLETRKKIEEDVMEALRNGNINMIGLYGMGGTGKTTMAKKIMDRVREEKLFEEAVMVVVSQQVKKSTIQRSIAEQLGLALEGTDLLANANKIHRRLTVDMKGILIVVDDVWNRLNLQEIGIPSGNASKKCKILLTSRDKSVLRIMETQETFEIKTLPEREAWLLFREKTGNCVEREDLHSIAEDVAKECKGLPVALVTVGGALKERENRQVWEDALLQLKSSNPANLPGVLEDVYNPIKLSYNSLGNQQVKYLFLLCTIFEEDVDIDLEVLTRYGMGLNMFEELRNLKEARDRTRALIELLKDRSLLLDGSDENYVKMHDVVRDVAIYTASEEKRGGFVIDFDRRSWENCPEDCFWISVTNLSNRAEFPVEFNCPSARLLMMQGGKNQWYTELLTILPENFFDGMQEIRVLSVEDIYVRSLPPTTQLLKNLKTLLLFGCHDLESISIVGELLKLEILSCCDCDKIEALPTEIGRLNRLKFLELVRCENLKRIVRGVISNLTSLDELRIKFSFRGWEAKESNNIEENAALVELEPLTKLTCLDIEINNASLVAEEICLPSQILKCHIVIREIDFRPAIMNKYPEYFQHQYCRTMCLEIPGHEMNVGNWIKTLLRSTEFLFLNGDWANQLINLVELEKLKILTLHPRSSVKTLVNTTSVFPLLETLILGAFWHGLDNLEEIMDSHNLHMAFPKLNCLHLCKLPRLVLAQETLDKIVAPDNLRELFLDSLNDDAMSSIWCVFSSFRNLERVEIYRMNGIKNLMSFSIAINLVHLKRLVVSECKMMLEVIANDDEEEGKVHEIGQISLFPRLEYLSLGYLHNLRSFCQWNHHYTTLELPSLKYVAIEKCFKMETFAQQSVSTPKLRKGTFALEDVEIKDLNEAILQNFQRWVQYFRNLHERLRAAAEEEVSSSSSKRE